MSDTVTINVGTLIDQLGTMTADGIADLMRTEGIKGYRGRSLDCPLANYLSREVGQRVRVTYVATIIMSPQYEIWRNNPAMRHFIDCFDNGNYPDLVANPPQVLPSFYVSPIDMANAATYPPVKTYPMHVTYANGNWSPGGVIHSPNPLLQLVNAS